MRTIPTLTMMLAALLAGCRAPEVSQNQQRSLLRGGSDNTVTAVLDRTHYERADALRERIQGVSQEVEGFLITGEVDELTGPEITRELQALVPADCHGLLSAFLAAVNGMRLEPGEALGEDNVDRLLAVCNGVIMATVSYRLDEHPDHLPCLNGQCPVGPIGE
jgi:hypothetical protein